MKIDLSEPSTLEIMRKKKRLFHDTSTVMCRCWYLWHSKKRTCCYCWVIRTSVFIQRYLCRQPTDNSCVISLSLNNTRKCLIRIFSQQSEQHVTVILNLLAGETKNPSKSRRNEPTESDQSCMLTKSKTVMARWWPQWECSQPTLSSE